jgi:hypothetical protein
VSTYPEIEEENCGSSRAAQLSTTAFDAGNLDVSSNPPHAQASTYSAIHEQLGSAQAIDEEEKPDDCQNGLYNAEDTGRQETCVRADNANGFEDSWAVVVDGIDSAAILPHEEGRSKEETPLKAPVLDDGRNRCHKASADFRLA